MLVKMRDQRMKVLHVNAGLEEGGAKTHILSLLSQFNAHTAELLVLEEGIVAREARALGISVRSISQTSRYDLSILKKMSTLINEGHYDIVHTHGARANLILSLIKNHITATWLTTVHSNPQLDFMGRGFKGKVFSYLNVRSLKKADGLITVTEEFKKVLIDMGIPETKISVVYNGLLFDGQKRSVTAHSVFTISYIARLTPIKGHEFLFESLQASSLNDFHLNVIGDGELREALGQKAQELKLANNIQFHGFLDKLAIEQILQKTDLSVLASYSEGFPLALLESANQRVPFISTDVGEVALLVPDKTYGWLVPVGDKAAFSQALKEAYADWQTNTLKEKGENLFELASNQFSQEQFYQETVAVYEKYNSKTRHVDKM